MLDECIQSFLNKTERAHARLASCRNSHPQFAFFLLRMPGTVTPHLTTKNKERPAFSDSIFMEAPVKTESSGFKTFVSHLQLVISRFLLILLLEASFLSYRSEYVVWSGE